MKSFRQIVAEVAQPSSGDELNFKEKHVIDHILDPNADENQFTADTIKKFKNRPDYDKGEDIAVYEDISLTRDVPGQESNDVDNDGAVDNTDNQLRYRRHANIKGKIIDEDVTVDCTKYKWGNMTDAQKEKREEIVLAMKKDAADLKKRYGDDWKSVMYATATKQAMAEDVEQIDEISKKTLGSYVKKATQDYVDAWERGGISNKMKRRGRMIDLANTKKSDLERKFQQDYGHSFDPDKPKVKVFASEEAQQIDEISRKTLVSYARKAPADAENLDRMSSRTASTGKGLSDAGHSKEAQQHYQRAGELAGKAGQRRQYFQKALTKLEALDPVGREDSDVDNDGKITKSDAYLKARRRAISKKLQQEGLTDVVQPAGGEFDDEPSHKAYKKKNRGQPHRHGEPLYVKENVNLANAQTGMKIFTGTNSKGSDGAVFRAGSVKLNDGTTINVSAADAEALNAVFETLNPTNREKMRSLAMSNKKGYQDIVSFAKEVM